MRRPCYRAGFVHLKARLRCDNAARMGATTSLVREAFRAFVERDRQAVRDLLDPEVVWYPALGALLDEKSYDGPDAVCSLVLDEIPSVIEGFTAEVLEIGELDEETALVLVRFNGRVPSVDMPIEQVFAQVHRVRNGKGIEMRAYPSKQEALDAALGIAD